jgi:hypothetical protein
MGGEDVVGEVKGVERERRLLLSWAKAVEVLASTKKKKL